MTCAPSNFLPERNPVGRPKEYDRMKIVSDFIQYAKNNPTCLTVPCFTSTIGIDSGMMRKWASESDEFRSSFNLGKEQIGINRLNATNEKLMERSVYSQVIGNFDIDINTYIREEKAFEAKLKIDEAKSVDAAFNDKFDQFNKAIEKGIEKVQSSKDLKSATNKIISEEKS